MFKNNLHANQSIRATLIISVCMLTGKLLDFSAPVYLALYPTIAVTKGKDFSWKGLTKLFIPTLIAATIALIVVEVFQDHPFAVWAISLFFFDWMRKRATTPAKRGALIMPLFNWIMIIIFSQTTTLDMPGRIREVFLSMLITCIVTKTALYLFPLKENSPLVNPTPQSVSYQNRLVSLALIGTGLAFLMIVDLLPATFCMVPVIAAATQPERCKFLGVVKGRLITQVGGCSIAAIFSVFMVGHQHILSFYGLGLIVIIFSISYLMARARGLEKDIHGDALLATVLPIQLYMGNTDFGLENIFLRAWQLTITLLLLWFAYQLTQPRKYNDQKHCFNTRTG